MANPEQVKVPRVRKARAGRPSPANFRRRNPGELTLGYSLVAPILIVMALVIAVPIVDAVWTSFQNQRVIGSEADFVGFATYIKILQDASFWDALGRSGIWLLLNLIIQTILAFSTALLLQRPGLWSRLAQVWVMLPWVIPTVAVTIVWQWMLNSNYGVIYRALEDLGLSLGSPFSDPGVVLFTIILVNSWHWFPLSAVVIYGALTTVPHEVMEAAKIDGANSWQTFISVVLPIMHPILFALGLVGSLWSFNVLDSIYLITEGGPAEATTTMPVYVYNTAFGAFRSSEAAAASVLTVLILVIAALAFVRFARPKED
ncbi:CUT1 ABC transporter permease [Pontimonas salivibrio]|uniref:CUT1 ABC transporter permease n=1 Tax=Pontimonas salivibrio TaxID=1159327 RepID=A0A2L2BP90_9MICO|nr:CUT1 ABC transporter permease [Pontimonas salivibrio]